MPAWRKEIAQAKINDFDVAGFADKNVFDLQIAMDNAVFVAVIQGTRNLSAKLARLFFLEFAMRNNVIEHLAAIYKLKEHIPMVVGSDNIAKAADVRMVQQRDNSSFASCSDFF